MASAFQLDPAYRRVSVAEFLAMHSGEAKAELVDGPIYMMAGGDRLHSRATGDALFVASEAAARKRKAG